MKYFPHCQLSVVQTGVEISGRLENICLARNKLYIGERPSFTTHFSLSIGTYSVRLFNKCKVYSVFVIGERFRLTLYKRSVTIRR